MKFAHLEHEMTIYNWQGSEIPYIGFDELTHFTERQFWYMLSRNRSTSGVQGYIRATTNPDCDSWVRPLIDWYIGADGFPIEERAGKIRWFIRVDDVLIWADSKNELIEKYGKEQIPKSFTFIPSKIYDNKILLEKDPAYLSNLMALSKLERARLLEGNWNARATAGMLFQRHWFTVIDHIPPGFTKVIRYWDRAATKPTPQNPNPDWTRGLKLFGYPNGQFVVADLRSLRDRPAQIEDVVKQTAAFDGFTCQIGIEQDPGSAGVADADNFVKLLAGYNVRTYKPTKDKITRALPVSAQSERGNIMVLRAPWNDEFFKELENFPPEKEGQGHDDIVDSFSGAFNALANTYSTFDVL